MSLTRDLSRQYSTYTGYWQLVSPGWLRKTWGTKLINTFGGEQDTQHDRLKAAVKARYPEITSTDALSLIGSDRAMPKWASTWDEYRARLVDAWEHWQIAGTDNGILKALSWCGFEDCTSYPPYDPTDAGYTFDPAQSVWVMSALDFADQSNRPDAPNTSWSVLWVNVDADVNNVTLDTHTWNDGTGWTTWGDGVAPNDWSGYGVWDFDVPEDTVNNYRDAIRTWKPAHMRCPHMLAYSGGLAAIWGSPGAWGDADEGNWGVTTSRKMTIGEYA